MSDAMKMYSFHVYAFPPNGPERRKIWTFLFYLRPQTEYGLLGMYHVYAETRRKAETIARRRAIENIAEGRAWPKGIER